MNKYQQESIKPIYAFIILMAALIVAGIIENL